MTGITKKATGVCVAIVAAAATAACGGHGPNTYLMPKEAVAAKLAKGSKSYPNGEYGKRIIRATGRSGDTINVQLSVDQGDGYKQNCKAIVEAVNEEWTRVTPSCEERGSAVGTTLKEIFEMQVDEWVIAVLHDRPIDHAMIAKRGGAVALDNMGAMRKEAVDAYRADQARKSQSTFASGSNSSDWGSDSAGGWGD